MSSPPPNKKRIDADVIKLYPFDEYKIVRITGHPNNTKGIKI